MRFFVVEITETGPLEKLVWAPIKDPDNEIKTIHNRTEEATEQGSGGRRRLIYSFETLTLRNSLSELGITSYSGLSRVVQFCRSSEA